MEGASHYLLRDPNQPNTFVSDLFAMGSTLYELAVGEAPYNGVAEDVIEARYAEGVFPSVDGIFYDCIIMGCWIGNISSAKDALLQYDALMSRD